MTKLTKMNVIKPDYHARCSEGSLVNLMTSIGQVFGRQADGYSACPGLAAAELAQYDNLILLVIDGMGYDYVQSSTGFTKNTVTPD